MQRTTVLPGIHSPLATLVHGASQCSGQHRLKLCGRCPRGPSPSRGTLARELAIISSSDLTAHGTRSACPPRGRRTSSSSLGLALSHHCQSGHSPDGSSSGGLHARRASSYPPVVTPPKDATPPSCMLLFFQTSILATAAQLHSTDEHGPGPPWHSTHNKGFPKRRPSSSRQLEPHRLQARARAISISRILRYCASPPAYSGSSHVMCACPHRSAAHPLHNIQGSRRLALLGFPVSRDACVRAVRRSSPVFPTTPRRAVGSTRHPEEGIVRERSQVAPRNAAPGSV